MTLKDVERVLYCEAHVVIDPLETPLEVGTILSEEQYKKAVEDHGAVFKTSMGGSAVKELLKKIDIESLSHQLRQEIKETKSEGSD